MREVVNPAGEPLSKEQIRATEEAAVEKLRSSEGGGVSPELQEALDKIDFNALRSIFAEIGKRCGIAEEDLNFLERDRIFSAPQTSEYDVRGNFILISDFQYFNEDGTKDTEMTAQAKGIIAHLFGSNSLHTLTELVHEYTHAVSRNSCVGFQDALEAIAHAYDDSTKSTGFRSGYNTSRKEASDDGSVTFQKIFTTFNEGVVEKLSREVTDEYLRRTGWPAAETAAYKQGLEDFPAMRDYAEPVRLVDRIVESLAGKTGQSQEVVWGSLVRGLMEGRTMEEPEVEELFASSYGPDFLEELLLP